MNGLVKHDYPAPALPTTPPQPDTETRRLCADLFAQPDRLLTTLTHHLDERFVIAPHRHEHALQLDVLDHVAGRAKIDDDWHDLAGLSLMATPPMAEHGYRLEPEPDRPDDARVYHARIAVDPDTPLPPWPRLLTGVRGAEALVSAMRVVVRLGATPQARPPLLLARLAEAICLWPTNHDDAVHPADDRPDTELRGLDKAVALLEQRLADPPSLDELAAAAHFSTRHLARRFRAAFGCTPHTYLTARRFAHARQLLSQERLPVGRIAQQLGFGSVATFSRWFSQQAGRSPTDFRKDPEIM